MYLKLPAIFLKFWYFEAPKSLFLYFVALSNAFFHMLSLPLFLRTFFRPLKNEYRGDLVAFSVGMGMLIKTALILSGLFLFTILLLFEIVFYLLFLALPLLTVLAVFIPI